jgi:hypothetical protein
MKLLILTMALTVLPTTLAADEQAVPRVVRNCEAGEIGDWAVAVDFPRAALYLANKPSGITRKDVRCQVMPDAKIMVLSTNKEEKQL